METIAAPTTLIDVSVVIPTHNRAHLLEQVVEGFLHQSHPAERYEIIVADDGSDDNTAAVLATLSTRSPTRMQVLRLPARGPAATRNAAIEAATGTLVLMAGDDVIPEPDLVARHLAAHQAHGDNAAILGTAPFRHPDGNTWMTEWLTRKHLGYAALTQGQELTCYHFITANVSVPRVLLQAVNGFDTTFPAAAAEDIELGRRLEAAGMRLFFHPEASAVHLHPLTLAAYRRRLIKTGRGLATLKRLHPDMTVLRPPRRQRLGVVWCWNPFKTLTFVLLYAWSVIWTLHGWQQGENKQIRSR